MVHWPKHFQSQLAYVFMIGLVPYIIGFELYVTFPFIFSDLSHPLLLPTLFVGIFLTVNVYGNMYLFIAKKSSIKGQFLNNDPNQRAKHSQYCAVCETFSPPRSHHCNVCNICILKRDHHCLFTGSCVGYFNHRHFIFLIFYFGVAALFTCLFNVPYIINMHLQNETSWMNIVVVTFLPLLAFLLGLMPAGQLVIAFTGTLCAAGCMLLLALTIYHLDLIITNQTTYERVRLINDYNLGWKSNLKQVFGEKWYWAAVWPFVDSSLPGNGLKFPTNSSNSEVRKMR